MANSRQAKARKVESGHLNKKSVQSSTKLPAKAAAKYGLNATKTTLNLPLTLKTRPVHTIVPLKSSRATPSASK